MDLINSTRVPAQLTLGQASDGERRRAIVTAKATFRLRDGEAVLDGQEPWPIYEEPEAYGEEMHLPGDIGPGVLPFFEVMLVGHARVTDPVTTHEVVMEVGEHRRSMVVTGDRRWEQDDDGAWQPSEPELFLRMPLSWSRAFGGAHQVEVDEGAFVPLVHASNPAGRGFWPRIDAQHLADHIGVEEGFPVVPEPGPLPNLESPDERLEQPEQLIMLPSCWAPMPREYAARYVPTFDTAGALDENDAEGWDAQGRTMALLGHTVAHPDWVLEEAPSVHTPVRVIGTGPEQSFPFPALQVRAEVMVGAKEGTRPLVPQAMVVLPDESAVTVMYRLALKYSYVEGERRAVRLHVEED